MSPVVSFLTANLSHRKLPAKSLAKTSARSARLRAAGKFDFLVVCACWMKLWI